MDVFVARQPIFDRLRRTYAYELLFRSGAGSSAYDGANADQASLRVLDATLSVLGLETLTGGKRAFINFTRDTLVNGYASIMPKNSVVVEILENVPPDDEVMEACRNLKDTGHLLALDDFVLGASYEELLEMVDIVMVDFLQNSRDDQARLVDRLRPRGIKLLAEKVETPDDFSHALDAGYHYFQGYFFEQPVVLSGKDVSASKLNLLNLLREINKPDADFHRIEAVIKREVALTYKLLSYMNRAAFAFRREVQTVQQALMMLGETGVKKWVSMVALTDMGVDKPFELVVTSVVRAKFCESMALRIGFDERAHDAFLMGLLSLIDTLLGRPLPELLGSLPITEDVRHALLGDDNTLGNVHHLAVAYEWGDWAEVSRLSAVLDVSEAAIPEIYLKAIEWGNSTVAMDGAG
jgi:c-di-GMP-related signal transduction protein